MSLGRRLDRFRWDLDRFGMTPRKLRTRLRRPVDRGLLAVSLPKAGTHLLERALCLHEGVYRPLVRTIHDANVDALGGLETHLARLRGGELLAAHLAYQSTHREAARRHDVGVVFVVRDPRDILVSQVFYIEREQQHPLHGVFAAAGSISDRLRLAIDGDSERGVESLADRLDAYSGWLEFADLTIRFEDLIGTAGGGDASVQQRTLAAVFALLDIQLEGATSRSILDRLVSRASPTFRRGRIGGWQAHFADDALRARLETALDGRLARYGYEEDVS